MPMHMAGGDSGSDSESEPLSRNSSTSRCPSAALILFTSGLMFAAISISFSILFHQMQVVERECAGTSPPPTHVPVVIVGGGIGGTYTAWRLASAADSDVSAADITLYERSDRIGGRLYSPQLAGCFDDADKNFVPRGELGGMRIRVGVDSIVLGLVGELGIKTGPFAMNGGENGVLPPQDDPGNPMWCRSKAASRAAYGDALGANQTLVKVDIDGVVYFQGIVPYVLPGAATPFVDPDGELFSSVSEYLRALTKACVPFGAAGGSEIAQDCNLLVGPPTLACRDPCDSTCWIATQEQRVHGGDIGEDVRLWQTSTFRQAFDTSAGHLGLQSDEGQLQSCLTGYATTPSDSNAAMRLYPFGDRATKAYVRPLQGMQDMPLTMAENFTDRGGHVEFNSELRAVERNPISGKYKLTFARTVTVPCTQQTQLTDEEFTVTTDRLILNLPSAAIDRIKFGPSEVDQQTMSRIPDAVSGEVLAKVFLTWHEPWFVDRTVAITGQKYTVGRYTSSTSISQTFAWYPGTQQPVGEVPPQCKDVYAMQLYLTNSIPGWQGSPYAKRASECIVADTTEQCIASCGFLPQDFVGPVQNQASKLEWQNLRTILRVLFPGKAEIPEPIEIQQHFWSADDPVTRADAVHTWRSGYRWWNEYAHVLEPLPSLHVIGEAFSLNWGWAMGAVETAEYMLEEKLGLARPAWLSRADYCKAMPYYPDRRNA